MLTKIESSSSPSMGGGPSLFQKHVTERNPGRTRFVSITCMEGLMRGREGIDPLLKESRSGKILLSLISPKSILNHTISNVIRSTHPSHLPLNNTLLALNICSYQFDIIFFSCKRIEIRFGSSESITYSKMIESGVGELRERKGYENEKVQSSLKSFKGLITADSEFQNENLGKSVTKLPPLKNNKTEERVEETVADLQPPPVLEKKITDQSDRKTNAQSTNTYVIKKVTQKRKTDKRKIIQESVKPEILNKYNEYINFLSYLNLSNNLKVHNGPFEKHYRLYVGKGNNGTLIKNLFKQNRPWWTIEENPDEKSINLHWYQLKQNHILEDLKSNPKSDHEFEKAEYFIEEAQSEQKADESMIKSVSRGASRIGTSSRSQSLIGKGQTSSFFSKRADIQMNKRVSSKSKDKSMEKFSKISPSAKKINLKELKEEGSENQTQMNLPVKKILVNPKMWPIYFNYRKIFSQSDMKKLKKMEIIRENGYFSGKIGRYSSREISNRSLNLTSHNHLENNWNLSNKKALFMCMKSYYEIYNINPFEYIPMTFHIEKFGDKQYCSFIEQYHRRTEQIIQDEKLAKKIQYKTTAFRPKKRNAWLVKPGENTNRGIGIEVLENLEQIQKHISQDEVDKLGRPRTYIIQEYIMPFLYHKRKFDIRCYILMTSVNGCQKGYWYQDGYIRTASKEFNMKNLSNKMIHLTNDAVQKKSEDYGKYEPGNKLSFADFQRYLDSAYNSTQGSQKLKFWQQAYPEMKRISTDAIKAVYNKINPHRREFCFQIFGLDFLIDDSFKVWLIEANTNPCLELASPLLGRIIPSMLQNALKIAVDPVFPPPLLEDITKLSKKINLADNPIESNKFELIFDEAEEGAELGKLLNSAPEISIYNIEEEEEDEYDEEGNAMK